MSPHPATCACFDCALDAAPGSPVATPPSVRRATPPASEEVRRLARQWASDHGLTPRELAAALVRR